MSLESVVALVLIAASNILTIQVVSRLLLVPIIEAQRDVIAAIDESSRRALGYAQETQQVGGQPVKLLELQATKEIEAHREAKAEEIAYKREVLKEKAAAAKAIREARTQMAEA